jgi:hypothetical protein
LDTDLPLVLKIILGPSVRKRTEEHGLLLHLHGVVQLSHSVLREIAVKTVTEWLKAHPAAMEKVIFMCSRCDRKAYYEAELHELRTDIWNRSIRDPSVRNVRAA